MVVAKGERGRVVFKQHGFSMRGGLEMDTGDGAQYTCT